MRLFIFALFIFLVTAHKLYSQISPPGMGNTKTALWAAAGLKQDINTKNALNFYLGEGVSSGPDYLSPFKRQFLGVINAEVSHTVNLNWNYSYALSYRLQDRYNSEMPYVLQTPALRQEVRGYGKLQFNIKPKKLSYSIALRQEIREFITALEGADEHETELRTRIKLGTALPLGDKGTSTLLFSAESFFSTSTNNHDGWNQYIYTESRFCFYYSYKPTGSDIKYDIGYMNNLRGTGHFITDANYLAFDIIIINPF